MRLALLGAFVAAGISFFPAHAEASIRVGAPVAGPANPLDEFDLANTNAAQFLYIYNTGSPGQYTGQYARYSLPGLTLLEMTAADGVGSPLAFGKNGTPYFVDEASGISGYAVYAQPIGPGPVAGVQQFAGIPCNSTSLAKGPSGNFYVVQYCSANVLEFTPGKPKHGKSKQPIATYTGGNLGSGGALPTYAAVDHKGNLYVGDNGGGVTFFAARTTKPVVIYPTGSSQAVTQLIVDSHNDVWSVHFADPTAYYFSSESSCVAQPSGPVIRNEIAEHFSGGQFVERLYTAPGDSAYFADQGLSIASDTTQRIYLGTVGNDVPSFVLDYAPHQKCPDLTKSLTMVHGASPQVAVDTMKRWYVTDFIDNTVASYKPGTLQQIAKITQQTGIINIQSAAVSPSPAAFGGSAARPNPRAH